MSFASSTPCNVAAVIATKKDIFYHTATPQTLYLYPTWSTIMCRYRDEMRGTLTEWYVDSPLLEKISVKNQLNKLTLNEKLDLMNAIVEAYSFFGSLSYDPDTIFGEKPSELAVPVVVVAQNKHTTFGEKPSELAVPVVVVAQNKHTTFTTQQPQNQTDESSATFAIQEKQYMSCRPQ